jgi:hypothetical protein
MFSFHDHFVHITRYDTKHEQLAMYHRKRRQRPGTLLSSRPRRRVVPTVQTASCLPGRHATKSGTLWPLAVPLFTRLIELRHTCATGTSGTPALSPLPQT